MFGRLFDNPMVLILILVVILLLFGAPKLPGMARSLGQSMRIFKSEVKEMKEDGKDDENTVVNGEAVDSQDSNGPASPGPASAPRPSEKDPAARQDSDGTAR
ncbi:twin-arginine translocase TatA/TatE family subunit [Kocuria coralli]|uniref:Sec-independent protein translocase protein TatA n=1 Tax=Kocuria coralli TaxID=1461025 RepID=A0A5J5KWR3_9MICC|nr:Sec-independent protein translocase subunit TatA [Kocuria coralli]KAA9393355.1 twin-arginine translocase TatA/TatE family subunit [Kocuria coralli]